MTPRDAEGLSVENRALVEAEFADAAPLDFVNATTIFEMRAPKLNRLLNAAREEGPKLEKPAPGEQPDAIWLWLADNGCIRKWSTTRFDQGAEYRRTQAPAAVGEGVGEGSGSLHSPPAEAPSRPVCDSELSPPASGALDSKWQPIQTAEADRFLVVSGLMRGDGPTRWVDIGRLDLDGKWLGQYGELHPPTHWMPLPSPPTASALEGC